MKGKKLVSVLTAGALAAAMAMPAFAADGGEVDVDVTTKTGILRVEVPTTLLVAVDQFETTDVGTQIHSGDFTIVNKSQVNVKVNVTSTATVGSNVTLVAKKADVATATGAGGSAWLAVAAKKDATHYEGTGADDNFANLNEAAANVTTFVKNGTATTAAQTFYLKKASGAESYAMLKPAADGKASVSYAQFYELTKKTFTASSEQTELDAMLAEGDVYVLASTTETDNAAITKTAKNATAGTLTYANTNTYYTIADAATPLKDVKAAKVYAYASLTTADTDGNAAFRYIGALSTNKPEWSATDISKVKIAYTIQGLPESVYTAAAAENNNKGITYGLYKEKVPVKYEVQSGKHYISVDGKAGFAAAPTSISVGGNALGASDYTFHDNKWIELKSAPTAGDEILITVNGTIYKATVPTP